MLRKLFQYIGISRRQSIGLLLFIFIGIFHPFIANENYIVGHSDRGFSFISSNDPSESGFKTLIPYSHHTIDMDNRNVGPFDKQQVSSLYHRHWLGTDIIGRDVLSGLLYGTGVAIRIGFLTTLLALILGLFFGFLSGYIGDYTWRMTWPVLLGFALVILLGIFYLIYGSVLVKCLALVIPFLYLWIINLFSDPKVSNGISIPLDIIILRLIEVFRSIPNMFLLLVLISLFATPNIWNVIIVIAFLRWPVVTRHLRAEILNIKNEDYITAAKVAGLSHFKIFKDYILPLTVSPVIIISAFGFASAILLESSLSFLGIGIPLDQVTWGSMLRDARLNISSWWLALFPGLLIYLVIYLFNSIGDAIDDRLQKTNR